MVAADPGFFSAANERAAKKMGVRRVSIPSHDTKSAAAGNGKTALVQRAAEMAHRLRGPYQRSNDGTDYGDPSTEALMAFGGGSAWESSPITSSRLELTGPSVKHSLWVHTESLR